MKSIALVLGLLFAAPCLASTPQTPAPSPALQSLEISTTRILNSIKNPDYVNPAKRGPLRRQIEDEVLHIFDFKEFSSRTVGARWRTFSPDQQSRFSDAFADLLINTYVNKIDGYNGEQVAYVGETRSPSGDRTEIRTVITMKDGKKVPVSYRMLPKGSAWHVYDVLIENVSLVMNYRTQFQDILNSATPDQLIERVKSKVLEVRK
ncbi:MAG: ABC transporter substrate-binding protein [Desulfovibrio sp.]|jgi:phospholipid transport system substrate-binding protein|nr:ABC transporter substrate-binding protein [Desulfovibrio sp.]